MRPSQKLCNTMDKDCAVIIVAGGKSKRMGTDKRMLPLGERKLLEIAVEKAKELSDEVIMVLSHPIEVNYQVKIVFDKLSGHGPLIGLYSGLLETRKKKTLLFPCDMPLVTIEFLKILIDQADGFDITIPQQSGAIQPLCAVYSKNVIPAVEEQLQKGSFSLLSLLKNPKLRIKIVKVENKFNEDDTNFLFFNVNTPEEYSFLKNLRALDSVAFVV